MNASGETRNRSTVRRKLIKWISRILIIFIGLPLGLLLIGFVYETIASKSDWARYPPAGELIDIGGYKLHLHCDGEREGDQPLVVIEAGSGSASQDWVLVQPEIAKFARVCTYDRAGLGWSDPGPEPRSSQQYATELGILLEKAGEEPPFILVAHSLGGHTVRIYTQEHPENVAGMVLVDSRPPSVDFPMMPMSAGQLKTWEFLARCGFFRLIGKRAMEAQAPSMAKKIPDYPIPIIFDSDFFITDRLQEITISESDKLVAETGPFGDLPLIIISREIPDSFNFLPPDEGDGAEAMWGAGQKDLLNLSTDSQFLIAVGSGHNIPIENPEIIISAVQGMLEVQ
jgi:pimeloyl-ACP methyl ester carboxylesterase